MIGAITDLQRTLEALKIAHQPRHATQGRHRRIVRMQREFNARFLGHRQDRLDVIGVICPHLLRAIFTVKRARRVFGLGMVIASGLCPAACPRRGRSAPDPIGHPVVAEDRNAGLTEIANRLLHILDLFIAPWLAQHRLDVELDRHIFNRVQAQPRIVATGAQIEQIGIFPAALAGQPRRVKLDILHPDLVRKLDNLRRQLVRLPNGNAHGEFVDIHGFLLWLVVGIREVCWILRHVGEAVNVVFWGVGGETADS